VQLNKRMKRFFVKLNSILVINRVFLHQKSIASLYCNISVLKVLQYHMQY